MPYPVRNYRSSSPAISRSVGKTHRPGPGPRIPRGPPLVPTTPRIPPVFQAGKFARFPGVANWLTLAGEFREQFMLWQGLTREVGFITGGWNTVCTGPGNFKIITAASQFCSTGPLQYPKGSGPPVVRIQPNTNSAVVYGFYLPHPVLPSQIDLWYLNRSMSRPVGVTAQPGYYDFVRTFPYALPGPYRLPPTRPGLPKTVWPEASVAAEPLSPSPPKPKAPPVNRLTWGNGGTGRATRTTGSPSRQPPGGRTKEKKIRGPRVLGLVMSKLNWFTEFNDLVGALYKAVDEGPCKERWKSGVNYKNAKGEFRTRMEPTLAQKYYAVVNCAPQINIPEAIFNIIANDLEDRVWAKLGIDTKLLNRSYGQNMGVNRLLGHAYGDAVGEQLANIEGFVQRLSDRWGLTNSANQGGNAVSNLDFGAIVTAFSGYQG